MKNITTTKNGTTMNFNIKSIKNLDITNNEVRTRKRKLVDGIVRDSDQEPVTVTRMTGGVPPLFRNINMPMDYDNKEYRSIPVQVRDEKISKIPVPVPNRNTEEEKHDGIDVGSLDQIMRNTNAPRPISHTGSAFSIGSNQSNRTSFNDNLMNINRNLEAEFNKSFIETENSNRIFNQPRSTISNLPQEFGNENSASIENLSELGFNDNEEFGILGDDVTPTIRKIKVNSLVKEYSSKGIKYLRALYEQYNPDIPTKEVSKMFPSTKKKELIDILINLKNNNENPLIKKYNQEGIEYLHDVYKIYNPDISTSEIIRLFPENKKKELIDIILDLKNQPHIVGKIKGKINTNLTSIEPFIKRTPYNSGDKKSTDKTSTEASTHKSPSKASTKLLRAIKESNKEEEDTYSFPSLKK